MATKRFDVALSFSGADRSYVSRVADKLIEVLGRERVFYDANFKGELARPNLDTYLEDIYANQSNLCAVFLSASYADREWCGIEWRVMRDILKQKKDEEIMYFKSDDTKIEGILSIDGYVDTRGEDPSAIADMILQRHRQMDRSKFGQGQYSNASSSFPSALSALHNTHTEMNERNSSPSLLRIFISYSHKDTKQKDEVVSCLGALPTDLRIKEWVDTHMLAGDKIDETIFREIKQTDLFLALISRYYLNSAYCREEMKTALMEAEKRGCRVVPIIVRKTASWRDWPIGQHLALPPDGKAPSDWNDPDEHWHAVEAGLKSLIREMSHLQNQDQSDPQSKSHHKDENTLNPDQTPLEPPPDTEFKASIRKALIDLFSHSRLNEAAEILLDYQNEVESTQAVDVLLQLEPLEAVERWNEVVTVLYDKTSVIGEAQRDVWPLLESVHLYLLPRLVDLTRLINDTRFPQDALLFAIAAPHELPNRPVELLFARMNRNRIVQFEQRGPKYAHERAVPVTAINATDPEWRDRKDPDVDSAVEQLGFELMKRFSLGPPEKIKEKVQPPEQMKEKDWKRLNTRLKQGRHGKLGFYLIIPHADRYADPVVLSRLYRYLPNLPKFLMAGEVGENLPFVCDPDEIDAVIETFWDLKIRWCG
jgi:hypothetical protein